MGRGYLVLGEYSSRSVGVLCGADGDSMSNGGGFIGTLACDPRGSTLFKALAAHSGAFYTDVNGPENGCAPVKPVPLLEIHGAADKTVKYDGGQGDGGPQPPITSWYVSYPTRGIAELIFTTGSNGGRSEMAARQKPKRLSITEKSTTTPGPAAVRQDFCSITKSKTLVNPLHHIKMI